MNTILIILMLIIPKIGMSVPVGDRIEQYKDNWLIGHNITEWYGVSVGDEIIYGGTSYTVTNVYRYKALQQYNPEGDMVDIFDRNQRVQNTGEIIKKIRCKGCLTLQTCIQVGNMPAWGRLFIVAKELP